ncbi:MAG: helix-turn-helix transcriptional regulator [Promethearchaeota archaeon]
MKEYREDIGLTQQQLADRVGVSRQTIYYLEKGDYNPSLTLSFKLTEIFQKPLELIFYQEPVITDLLGSKTLDEIEKMSEETGIKPERIIKLKKIDEDDILKFFTENELYNICKVLRVKFEDLFQKEV